MVTATLLYAMEIWGLRYLDVIEGAQLNFFKGLLNLPSCTTSSAIRLELGIRKIAYRAMELAWAWVIRLLRMDGGRFPRICFDKQRHLFLNSDAIEKYNWVAQSNELLVATGFRDLWESVGPDHWASVKEQVFENYANYLKAADYEHYTNTNSCHVPIPRSLEDTTAVYLKYRIAPAAIKLHAQLRLAPARMLIFRLDGITYIEWILPSYARYATSRCA